MAKVAIALDREDFQQIIGELSFKIGLYTHTAKFLEDEDNNFEGSLIEDVRDSDEARTIAGNYERIIREITRQIS